MQSSGPKHIADHSDHPHVDLGKVALGAVLFHMRGGMIHQDPRLQVFGDELRLNIVHLNEFFVTA